MSYNNSDGLRVITGLDQGAAIDAGTTTKSEVKTLVIDIADATELGLQRQHLQRMIHSFLLTLTSQVLT